MGVFPLSINAHSPRSQRAVQVQEQSPSSGSRGSHGVVGLPRFFCDCSAGVRPRFFAILFFFRQDSTGFSFATFRPILTNFDHDKKSKLSTLFDTDIYRQISTFPMSNFDKFRPLQFFDKFRPIPTNSLFSCFSLLLYADIQKVYIFLIDKFRACSPFLFVTSQFYYNTKIF